MDPTTRFAGLTTAWLLLVVLLGGWPALVVADPGLTIRISVNSAGTQADGDSCCAVLSATGRFVAFESLASNLVADDTNDAADIFVHDRRTGTTTRVSVDSEGIPANGDSGCPAVSADGRFVAFWSAASNLVADDTNGAEDIFVHDRRTGTTTRVSVDGAGIQANEGSSFPILSGTGRFVAFESVASNLVAGDTNGVMDVFVHDRHTGTTIRVSVDSAGAQADNFSFAPALSADGRSVAFTSSATNLVAGDTNGAVDIFVHQR